MSIKSKIFTTISTISLIIILAMVGVWSVTDTVFKVSGDTQYSSPMLKYDETNDYYYVRMGTYNNAPVRWKLVGTVEENGEYLQFGGYNKPTSGTGVFILETNVGITHAFGSMNETEQIGNNNYSASYIREYLTGVSTYALDYNGENDTSDQGNFLTDLKIATNDPVYSAITARTISDLHAEIGWARSTGGNVPNEGGDPTYAPPKGTIAYASYSTTMKNSTGSDKLWLPSIKEIYTLIGGGIPGDNGTIPFTWDTLIQNELIWNSLNYWLRTPNPYNSYGEHTVASTGNFGYPYVNRTHAVRPAFILDFKMGANAGNPSPLKYDETNDYYYVNMGTYNNTDVRWRLVGINDKHFDGSYIPTSGKGTFILETNVGIKHVFGSYDANVPTGNNDYSTSYIREYLTGKSTYALDYNGNNDTSNQGSFLTDLNISKDDPVYSIITPRSINDLYTEINWDTSTTFTDGTPSASNKTTSDKLWLPSVKEIYTLVGGGDVSTISDTWDSTITNNLIWNYAYWLRSPYPYAGSYVEYVVYKNGGWSSYSVQIANAVRPMFTLDFKMGANAGSPSPLEYDETNDYYYVNMGTYNNAPVRWKLVGTVEENGEYLQFGGYNKPTSGTGVFILETNVGITHAFGSINSGYNTGNNNYSASYIREYLTGKSTYALDYNGNNDTSDQGNFLTDLKIATNDPVYSAITARSISDLHTDIGWAIGNIGGGQHYAPPAGTIQNATYDTILKNSTGSDKLWLPSTKEIYTMVGGGTLGENGTIPSPTTSWPTEVRNNLIWNSLWYWLRSPYSDYSYSASAINNTGYCYNYRLHNNYAVRPMFLLDFKMGENAGNPSPLKYDETNDYYYVNMGTYNNTDVRWRLVGINGRHFDGSYIPTSGKGTFILETVTTLHIYGSRNSGFTEGNNDYSTSYVREYLTGIDYALNYDGSDAPDQGSFLDDLNIQTDDAVYSAIQGREISDLYKNMAWDIENTYNIEDMAVPNGATGTDKLWLMSVEELYTIVCGETITNSNLPRSAWTSCSGISQWASSYYWLRTPHPTKECYATRVQPSGTTWYCNIGYNEVRVRPAFNLDI